MQLAGAEVYSAADAYQMSGRSEKPIVDAVPVLLESPVGAGADLRVEPRFPFTAGVDLCEIHTQTRMRARCSDLSSKGCYIDMTAPFNAGSVLRIRIEHEMREFQAVAVVAYAIPPMGMGLKFTEIKPEYQDVLRFWIARLSGKQSPEPPASTKVDETPASESDSNSQLVLNELISLLVRKKILSENEMTELLMQLFR